MRGLCDDGLLKDTLTMKFSFQVEFMCWVCTVCCCVMLSCLVVSWLVLWCLVVYCVVLRCLVLCGVGVGAVLFSLCCIVVCCAGLCGFGGALSSLIVCCGILCCLVLHVMFKKHRHDTSIWVCTTWDTECIDLASSTMIKTTNRSNSVYMRRAKV